VVDALTDWFAAFGVSSTWVSDRGSHFKNVVIDGARRALRSRHHFTTAYSPWANGTVERACKEVLRASRALLSEFRLPPTQWNLVYKIVQGILNNLGSPQRGGLASLTIFMGRPADSPLLSILKSEDEVLPTLSDVRAQQILCIDKLRGAVDAIHKQAHDTASSRQAASRSRSQLHPAVLPNYDVVDFVLVAHHEQQDGAKLTLRWRGP
jgi:hypothetical protein